MQCGVTGGASGAAEIAVSTSRVIVLPASEAPPFETIASATLCSGVPGADVAIAGAGSVPGAATIDAVADVGAAAFLGGTVTGM